MLFTGLLIVLWILSRSHEPQGPIPPSTWFHQHVLLLQQQHLLFAHFPQFVQAVHFAQRYRNKRRWKTSNPSKSRDPVAMKECGKSKGSWEIDLHEREGDSQYIDFPCRHRIVLCPYSLSHHILPGLPWIRRSPVALLSSMIKKPKYQWN